MSEQHETECQFLEEDGWVVRPCICTELRAHGAAVLREWVETGTVSGRDPWITVHQLQMYAAEMEEQAEQRGFEAGLREGMERSRRATLADVNLLLGYTVNPGDEDVLVPTRAEMAAEDRGYAAGIKAAIELVELLPAQVTRMTERGVYRSTVVEKLRELLAGPEIAAGRTPAYPDAETFLDSLPEGDES